MTRNNAVWEGPVTIVAGSLRFATLKNLSKSFVNTVDNKSECRYLTYVASDKVRLGQNKRPARPHGGSKMNIENAIARSCTHTEIVACEFAGTEKELRAWLNDNTAGGQTISRENDGTIDVADDAWRIRVTLV